MKIKTLIYQINFLLFVVLLNIPSVHAMGNPDLPSVPRREPSVNFTVRGQVAVDINRDTKLDSDKMLEWHMYQAPILANVYSNYQTGSARNVAKALISIVYADFKDELHIVHHPLQDIFINGWCRADTKVAQDASNQMRLDPLVKNRRIDIRTIKALNEILDNDELKKVDNNLIPSISTLVTKPEFQAYTNHLRIAEDFEQQGAEARQTANLLEQQRKEAKQKANLLERQMKEAKQTANRLTQQAETATQIANRLTQQAETATQIANRLTQQAEMPPQTANLLEQEAEGHWQVVASNKKKASKKNPPKQPELCKQQMEEAKQTANRLTQQAETAKQKANRLTQQAETATQTANLLDPQVKRHRQKVKELWSQKDVFLQKANRLTQQAEDSRKEAEKKMGRGWTRSIDNLKVGNTHSEKLILIYIHKNINTILEALMLIPSDQVNHVKIHYFIINMASYREMCDKCIKICNDINDPQNILLTEIQTKVNEYFRRLEKPIPIKVFCSWMAILKEEQRKLLPDIIVDNPRAFINIAGDNRILYLVANSLRPCTFNAKDFFKAEAFEKNSEESKTFFPLYNFYNDKERRATLILNANYLGFIEKRKGGEESEN